MRNFEAYERITVKLIGDGCPWNRGAFSISTNNGKLKVERMKDDSKLDVILSPYQVSQVIGGRTPAVTLRKLGMSDCSEDIAEKLDDFFPVENFISYFRF